MGATPEPVSEHEQRLIELAIACKKDPLKFVLAAYPWAENFEAWRLTSGFEAWRLTSGKFPSMGD